MDITEKYLVVKRDELDDILNHPTNEDLRESFHTIMGLVALRRKVDGKPKNKYLVINNDEIYADRVKEIMAEHGHIYGHESIKFDPNSKYNGIQFKRTNIDAIQEFTGHNLGELTTERTPNGKMHGIIYSSDGKKKVTEGEFIVKKGPYTFDVVRVPIT